MTSDHDENPYSAPQTPSEIVRWDDALPPNEYRYPRSMRRQQFVGWFCFAGLAASYVFYPPPWNALAIAQVSALLPLVLIQYFCYRLSGVTIVLEDRGLVYRHRGGELQFPFDAEMVIDTACLAQWLRIRSRNSRVIILPALSGIGHLICSLKAALDIRGFSSAYDRKKLFAYLRTVQPTDHLNTRFSACQTRIIGTAILGGATFVALSVQFDPRPFVLGYVPSLRDIDWLLLWVVSPCVWPLMVWAGTEAIFYWRFSRGVNEEIAISRLSAASIAGPS